MRDLFDDVRDLGRGRDIHHRDDDEDEAVMPESALDHDCPICSAGPGMGCVTVAATKDGRQFSPRAPHKARRAGVLRM